MKILLIAVLCLSYLVGGCAKGKSKIGKDFAKNTKTVVIDGCEYLMFIDSDTAPYVGFGYAALTHKGNCRFCKEN